MFFDHLKQLIHFRDIILLYHDVPLIRIKTHNQILLTHQQLHIQYH